MKKTKLVITGGHLTPAIAFIDKVKDKFDLYYLSRLYSQEKTGQISVEWDEIKKRNINYIYLKNLTRFSLSFNFFVKFFKSINESIKILKKIRPDLIVSFGSYVSVPIVISAFLLHIPIIVSEQTQSLGLANLVGGLLAKKICFTFDVPFIFKNKGEVIGNPIREQLFSNFTPEWSKNIKKPILTVLGGNQGSLFLNNFIFENIDKLTKQFTIVHATGKDSKLYKPYKKALFLKNKYKHTYFPYEWIDVKLLGFLYKNSQLFLSRSGANTVYELAVFRAKAILVPLPISRWNEQLKNAKWYTKKGLGIYITQDKFNINSFFLGIDKLKSLKAKDFSIPLDANKKFIKCIYELIK